MQIVRSAACAAALACASLVCSASAGSASTNLLTNGSFETGDFSGWTAGGNFSYMSVTSGGYGPEDGSYSVYFGPIGSDATLSQTLTTTPGATYLLSGWLAGNGSGYSEWGFSWDGTTDVFVSPVPSQGYVQYTATAIGTGSDTFTTFFRNDPSFDGADNYSVTQTSSVPEASTWAMLLVGFAGLGFAATRRARVAAAV